MGDNMENQVAGSSQEPMYASAWFSNVTASSAEDSNTFNVSGSGFDPSHTAGSFSNNSQNNSNSFTSYPYCDPNSLQNQMWGEYHNNYYNDAASADAASAHHHQQQSGNTNTNLWNDGGYYDNAMDFNNPQFTGSNGQNAAPPQSVDPASQSSHEMNPDTSADTASSQLLYDNAQGYQPGATAHLFPNQPDLFGYPPRSNPQYQQQISHDSQLSQSHHQPDMIASSFLPTQVSSTEEFSPPDMVPHNVNQSEASADHVLANEDAVQSASSGPDILSNRLRGEGTRPDILSPAGEDNSVDGGESRASSVIHSPAGAFEPVVSGHDAAFDGPGAATAAAVVVSSHSRSSSVLSDTDRISVRSMRSETGSSHRDSGSVSAAVSVCQVQTAQHGVSVITADHSLTDQSYTYTTSSAEPSQASQHQVYNSQISSNESEASLLSHMAGLSLDQNSASSSFNAGNRTADPGVTDINVAAALSTSVPSATPLNIGTLTLPPMPTTSFSAFSSAAPQPPGNTFSYTSQPSVQTSHMTPSSQLMHSLGANSNNEQSVNSAAPPHSVYPPSPTVNQLIINSHQPHQSANQTSAAVPQSGSQPVMTTSATTDAPHSVSHAFSQNTFTPVSNATAVSQHIQQNTTIAQPVASVAQQSHSLPGAIQQMQMGQSDQYMHQQNPPQFQSQMNAPGAQQPPFHQQNTMSALQSQPQQQQGHTGPTAVQTPVAGYNPQASMNSSVPQSPMPGYGPQTSIAGFSPVTSMAGYGPQTSMAGFNPQAPTTHQASMSNSVSQAPMAGYGPQTSMAGYGPQTSMAGFNPQASFNNSSVPQSPMAGYGSQSSTGGSVPQTPTGCFPQQSGMMSQGQQQMPGFNQPGFMSPMMQQQMMFNQGYFNPMMMPQMYMNPNQQPQQQQFFPQMNPQLRQRLSMMQGFRPLSQQQITQLSGTSRQSSMASPVPGPRFPQSTNSSSNSQQMGGASGKTGPVKGFYPTAGYAATIDRQSLYETYRRNEDYYNSKNKTDKSKKESRSSSVRSSPAQPNRDDSSQYGYDDRPSSRSGYEGRGYGYGSRPSSRTGTMGMYQGDMYNSQNQIGFSPRPPSRTSSRLSANYQTSVQAESSSSSESEEEPSGPVRMTPAKFPLPHLTPRLLANGCVLEVQANNPDEGQPATVSIVRRIPQTINLLKFPGPLIRSQTHKKDVLDFCMKMVSSARTDSTLIDSKSTQLIWLFLHKLVKQNGTYVGSDIAELLLEDYDLDTDRFSVANRSTHSDMSQQEKVDRFRELLLHGNSKEALEWAMSTDQWGHAFFLSSKISNKIFSQVLTRFANASMVNSDPLQTVYQLMSGRQPSSCGSLDEAWGSWRPHLAMMLSNSSEDTALTSRSIITLGDSLAAKGLLHASQFCYLMAGVELEPYTKKSAKLSMIGVASGCPVEEFTQEATLRFTEVYEYALSLANENVCIPHLQICKFFHARRLVDQGLPHDALAYCEAIASRVNNNIHLFSYDFMRQLSELSNALKHYDSESLHIPEGQTLELPWLQCLQANLQHKLTNTNFTSAPSLNKEASSSKQNADSGSVQRSRNPSAASTKSQTHQFNDISTAAVAAAAVSSDSSAHQQHQQQSIAAVQSSSRTKHVSGSSAHSHTSKQDATDSTHQYGYGQNQSYDSNQYNQSQQQGQRPPMKQQQFIIGDAETEQQYYQNQQYSQTPSQQYSQPQSQQPQQPFSNYGYTDNMKQQNQQMTQQSQTVTDQSSSYPQSQQLPQQQQYDYNQYQGYSAGDTSTSQQAQQQQTADYYSYSNKQANPQQTHDLNNPIGNRIRPPVASNPYSNKAGNVTATSTGIHTRPNASNARPPISRKPPAPLQSHTTKLAYSYPNSSSSNQESFTPAAPSGPPALPSRSLSSSASSRSLAEMIKEKREMDRFNSILNSLAESKKAGTYMSQAYLPKKPAVAQHSPESSSSDDSSEEEEGQAAPAAQKKAEPTAKSSGPGFFGSLISKILPTSKNEMKLPDDSKQTIVWDEKLKKWVNTEEDESDAVKTAPPPSDAALFGRSSSMPAAPVQPQVQLQQPQAPYSAAGPQNSGQVTNGQGVTAPSPNRFSLNTSRRGARSQYVDVLGKTAASASPIIPQHLFDVTPRSTPVQSMFTPTPLSESDQEEVSTYQQQQHNMSESQSAGQQGYAAVNNEDQMPRNLSLASLEVSNIMNQDTRSSNNQQQLQPQLPNIQEHGGQASGSAPPQGMPMLFNPNNFKKPMNPPGGRMGLGNMPRYPK